MGQALGKSSTWLGQDAKQIGSANLLTPEQQSFLSQVMGGGMGGQAGGALGNLLQGYNEDFFQKSVVDPSMKGYKEQILPALAQQFQSAGAGSSSALNQALTKSAQDLSGSLAGQRIGLQSSMAQQQQGGFGILSQLMGQRAFQPIVQDPTKGLLGDVMEAISKILAAKAGAGD